MSEEPGTYTAGREERHAHAIKDEAAPIANFAMIPNIIDHMHLTPQAYRLYGHLRRVIGEAGGGACWQSTRTMADACDLGVASIFRAKRELMTCDPPLIRVQVKQKNEGGYYHEITLIDIWTENNAYFNDPLARSKGERVPRGNPRITRGHQPRSPVEHGGEKRGDVFDLIKDSAGWADEQQITEVEGMLTLLEKELTRNIPRINTWQIFARWLLKHGEEDVKRWCRWYMEDDFRRINSWRLTPEQVRNSWPQAFVEAEKEQQEVIW
jgi:hypothetical protein